ncbi:MAG: uracil-DNA glycosylase [bacterium]
MEELLNSEDPEEWLEETKKDRFETFRNESVVGDHCEACQYSPDPVIKRGSLDADLVVVGSYPSGEDFQNRTPFSGAVGELLDEMLAAIDLDVESDCYLTNALLCGGPEENPAEKSVDACRINVNRQLELVSPDVVLGLGKYAYCSLYHEPVSTDFRDKLGYQGSIPDFPWLEGVVTVHPAMILHQPEGSDKRRRLKQLAWDSLQRVESILREEPVSDPDEEDEDSSK